MNYVTLLHERLGQHVLIVRLNRPAAANALNTQMGRELFALFHGLILDPAEVRCVVLSGAGDKSFCAGGDLKERNGMSDDDWRRQHAIFEQAFYALMDCPVPVIAAVNGAAYGGGCELALACDFIYASHKARFAFTETSLGIIPGGGGTQQLPRAVGARRARELIYSAEPFSAEQALAWGMVNQVFLPQEVISATIAMAERIARNAPMALRQAKRAIYIGTDLDLKSGLAMEIEAYNRLTPTADRIEGVTAFNEKRPPQFRGA